MALPGHQNPAADFRTAGICAECLAFCPRPILSADKNSVIEMMAIELIRYENK